MKSAVTFIAALAALIFARCTTNPGSDPATQVPAGMALVASTGQSFLMGSSTDGDPTNDTAHTVTFTYDYWIDITEVTQADYQSLTGVNPSTTVGDSLPVHNTTWFDAVLYCNARSLRDGRDTVYSYDSIVGAHGSGSALIGCRPDYTASGYRLPSESEWEFAARGGSTGDVPWGTFFDAATDSFAWHMENSGFAAHPVARLQPNSFGLYDMFGNAREWCTDWFAPFGAGTITDPFGPDSGTTKALRNGDAYSDRNYLRVAYRNSIGPLRTGSQLSGFRVACQASR